LSDVWRELIEQLKQKAKTPYHICTDEKLIGSIEKWVRVDDVLQAINQLKQNYVLIDKELTVFPNSCQACKNYNHQKLECRLSACPYSLKLKELLRENEVQHENR
jgi:predicted Zn-ribbon and HTH transcriptional regulator